MFDWFIVAVVLSTFVWVFHEIFIGKTDDVGPIDVEHEHPLPEGERLPYKD